jgi:hypothetical protein
MKTPYDRRFYERQQALSLSSAKRILPALIKLLGPRSIVDIGCGVATWLSVAQAAGVADILGMDGGHVERAMLKIPADKFIGHDLAKPVKLDRRFDLAMSLEVAEHLPAERADGFVADLVALAPVVLFSAAIPHQAGVNHVNLQWPGYWAERFAKHGYRPVDLIRNAVWYEDGVAWWYAQNILLYASAEAIEANARLKEAAAKTDPKRLARVHHGCYLDLAEKLKGANAETRELQRMLRRVDTVKEDDVKI